MIPISAAIPISARKESREKDSGPATIILGFTEFLRYHVKITMKGPELPNRSDEYVTRILSAVSNGEPGAAEQLLPLVYEELRKIAGRAFRAQRAEEKTIQPTILVHDVFMKLVRKTDRGWESRAHFFAVAAKATRDLLVDHARRRNAAKRGGGWKRVSLSGLGDEHSAKEMIDVLDLEEALEQLKTISPRQERIVEMRYFGGLSVEEVAAVLDVSVRTIMYDWRMARAWLRARIEDEEL